MLHPHPTPPTPEKNRCHIIHPYLPITATFLQQLLSSVLKMAIVGKFYCNHHFNISCVFQFVTQAMFYRLLHCNLDINVTVPFKII